MSGPIIFTHTTTDLSPITTTLTFNPTLASIVQPRFAPTQRVNIAENGHPWIYQISNTVNLELPLEFLDLPTDDITSPIQTAGYNTLHTFLETVTGWSRDPFVLTTVNEQDYIVRYLRGFETMREGVGRAQRGDRWSGTLILWRIPE